MSQHFLYAGVKGEHNQGIPKTYINDKDMATVSYIADTIMNSFSEA